MDRINHQEGFLSQNNMLSNPELSSVSARKVYLRAKVAPEDLFYSVGTIFFRKGTNR